MRNGAHPESAISVLDVILRQPATAPRRPRCRALAVDPALAPRGPLCTQHSAPADPSGGGRIGAASGPRRAHALCAQARVRGTGTRRPHADTPALPPACQTRGASWPPVAARSAATARRWRPARIGIANYFLCSPERKLQPGLGGGLHTAPSVEPALMEYAARRDAHTARVEPDARSNCHRVAWLNLAQSSWRSCHMPRRARSTRATAAEIR